MLVLSFTLFHIHTLSLSLSLSQVAVKIIDKKKAQQDSYVAKNFRREARLLQMVNHPNILQLLEVIETDNSYYLITELCTGNSISMVLIYLTPCMQNCCKISLPVQN